MKGSGVGDISGTTSESWMSGGEASMSELGRAVSVTFGAGSEVEGASEMLG